MRHILLTQPVTAVSFGMLEAAIPALLVTAAGCLEGSAAGRLGAASSAVDLAPVAAAADDDLGAAARAQEESAGGFHWRFPSRQGAIDRKRPLVKYSPCTRAQHGVGHDIGVDLRVWPVSCSFFLAGPFYRIASGLVIPACTPWPHPRQVSPMAAARQEGASPVALRAPSDAPSCRTIGGPTAPTPRVVSATDRPSPVTASTARSQLSALLDRH